ncbi:RND transporter [Dyella flava]|nr:RND transporter [Dyella flava]
MTVGPNYHVPAAALVNAPDAQRNFTFAGANISSTPAADQWWRLYDDPVLNRLVKNALNENIQLRVAAANLQRSQAMVIEAEAQHFSGSINAAEGWQHPSEEAVLQRTGITPFQGYAVGTSISYDLDLFGAIRRGIEAAKADDAAVVAARDLVRINVVAQTASAYADVCNAGHEIALMKQKIAIEEKFTRFTSETVSRGRVSPTENARQQDVVASLKAKLPMLESSQRNAAIRIAVLQGKVAEDYDPSLLTCDAPLHLDQELPVGSGQDMLRRRPDVRMAERRLAAATAQIGVATAALYPDIQFGVSLGSTGVVGDALTGYTNQYGIGPSVSWDLNRKAVRARIAEANAESRARLGIFDETVLEALKEVETSLDNYAADRDRRTQLQAALNGAVKREQEVEELYGGGRIDALTMLAAQRDSWTAELALADIERTLNHDQIDIFLALGGGWQGTPKS